MLLSVSKIYKMLAIWIYGEQFVFTGVQKNIRPLRSQLEYYRKEFRRNYPTISSFGIRFAEIFTSNFTLDKRYSEGISSNFRSILRGIGRALAGDEKLLHFSGASKILLTIYVIEY